MYRSGSGRIEIGKPVVIVRTGAGPIGLAVDELLGRQEIVIKPIGSLKSLERSSFGGATIDPEGRVVLVLDPARLISGGEKSWRPGNVDRGGVQDRSQTCRSRTRRLSRRSNRRSC